MLDPSPSGDPIMNLPAGTTTISGHAPQSRNTAPGRMSSAGLCGSTGSRVGGGVSIAGLSSSRPAAPATGPFLPNQHFVAVAVIGGHESAVHPGSRSVRPPPSSCRTLPRTTDTADHRDRWSDPAAPHPCSSPRRRDCAPGPTSRTWPPRSQTTASVRRPSSTSSWSASLTPIR